MYPFTLIKQSISLFISFSLLSSQTLLAVENINNTPNPQMISNNPSNIPTPPNPNNLPTPPIIIDNSITPNNPTLDTSKNHIPVINIASPNDVGISNNYYKEFNVRESGVIFNNSKDLITSSELAGLINGNINLKDKEASLILNQVTGTHLSELLGAMEIAGKKADLILANPNGITCKGCSFINSSSSTLTTGKISLEELERLNHLKDLSSHLHLMVQRGHINIEALNASNIPTLNLIAKSLSIDKNLLANKLNIILGSNKVGIDLSKNASLLLYEPIEIAYDINKNDSKDKEDQATSKTKIALALDVAYLGSALAHSIYLVATEEGIGVKNSGRIATVASEKEGDGGFIINVNGKIEIAKPKEAYEAYKQEQNRIKEEQQSKSNNVDAIANDASIASNDSNQSNIVSLSDSTSKSFDDHSNHTTLDTLADTFIPPSITSSSDLTITAKELENHSILSAKGNLQIKADTINNIGSLELEKVQISKTHHYEQVGDDDYNTTYDYNTIITEEHLKEGTYDPAIISAKNIHIEANNLKNDTAILAAEDKLDIKANTIINTQPIPKRVEKKVGTSQDYKRLTHCGVWGLGMHFHWNCRSDWGNPISYTPAPIISSIPLSLPSVDLESLVSNIEESNTQTLFNSTLNYKIETNPLYTSKDNFISSSEFNSFLHNQFLPTHPLEDITGIIDSINKNTQDFIDHKMSLNGYSNLAILNPTKNLNPNNTNNALALNNTDDPSISDEDNSTSSTTIKSKSSTLASEEKAKTTKAGLYSKDITVASTAMTNSSKVKANNIAINAKFLLSKNGEIVANDKLDVSSDTFENISSHLAGKKTNIDAKHINIVSATNEGKTTNQSFDYDEKNIDSLSSIEVGDLSINAKSLKIAGTSINADKNIYINADSADIDTTESSRYFSDNAHTSENTSHLKSTINADNIYINAKDEINIIGTDITTRGKTKLASDGTIGIKAINNVNHYSMGSYYDLKTQERSPVYVLNNDSINNPSFKVQDLSIQAKDVNIEGSKFEVKDDFNIDTQNLKITATKLENKKRSYGNVSDNTTHYISSIQTKNIRLNSNNIDLYATDFNASENLDINAKNNLSVGVVQNSSYGKKYGPNEETFSDIQYQTSNFKANNVNLNGNNINLTSVSFQADNDINLNAQGSINFNSIANSSMDKVTTTTYSEGKAKDFDFTSTTTTTTTTDTSNIHLANSIKANNVHMNSNASINANNLAIAATGEASMDAKENITISNLADTFSHTQQTHQEKSGLSFSQEGDNYSVSIGKDSADISDNTSASLHHQQNIQASSISMSANNKASIESSNLIANNGDISISASDVSITSLKDNFTHQKDEKYTSNKVGISVPKSYVGELGKAAGKSALNGLGKGLQWVGDHLDPNNPNNTIVSNHPGLYSTPGKWLSKGADKISSPSLSEIDHFEVGVGFTHTDQSNHQLSSHMQNSSSTLVGNNISISAKNKADIIGSNLKAQNDINLAAKSLNITSSANTDSSSSSSTSNSGSVALSANIGKDTSISLEGKLNHSEKEDSTRAITQAASSLSSKNLHINTVEDTHIQGSSINATNSATIKAKSFSLTSSENTLSTHHKDSSATGDMKLSYNGSFGGEMNANYNKNNTDTQDITHNASSLNTNKLSIVTSETSNIIGSSINAKDGDIKSKSLNILATKDTSSSDSKSDAYSASIGVNLSNLASSKLGGNIQRSSTTKDSTTYKNASLNIDNFKLNTEEDLNIKGGNVVANNLQATIKGNMNIESLQDSHSEKHKDLSLGASLDKSNFKPSFSSFPTNSSTFAVKAQSGINVHNSLQVNVGANTDLKGAYINVDEGQNSQTPSTLTTHSLSSSDIINSSHTEAMRGIKGDKEETNISKTLASLSKNTLLKQDTDTNTTIHRTSPTNETPKEASLPTTKEKSIFNTLVESKDITKKVFDLSDKAIATFKTDKSLKGFKEITKETLKDTDKGIDLAYSDVKPLVSSLADVIGDDESKKIANGINNSISLTHNTKEMSKGVAKVFTQSFKEDVKGTYEFVKPFTDSILDVGWKNTSDLAESFINNKGENAKAPKTIFNNAWNTTKKQSNEATNTFMHKVLWE